MVAVVLTFCLLREYFFLSQEKSVSLDGSLLTFLKKDAFGETAPTDNNNEHHEPESEPEFKSGDVLVTSNVKSSNQLHEKATTKIPSDSMHTPHNEIVVLKDDEVWDNDTARYSGLGTARCKCTIDWVKPRDFSKFNWASTGTVIVHVNSVNMYHQFLETIPAHVIKVLYWRELYYPIIDPQLQRKFDVYMGTGFNDPVMNPCHFPSGFVDILPIAKKRQKHKKKRKHAEKQKTNIQLKNITGRNRFAVHLSSRCSNDLYDGFRGNFIDKLREKIDIEVQGKCGKDYGLNVPPFNAPLIETHKFFSNYKFYIAVENTGANNYVSEKIFQGLGSGAIPVYLGASTMSDFPKLDGKSDWFIDARDFESIDALGEFLIDLASDEVKFQKYLEWHQYALSGGVFMPNATESVRECVDQTISWRLRRLKREAPICWLCNPLYLEKIIKRRRVDKVKVGYPESWEISHHYTNTSGLVYWVNSKNAIQILQKD